MKMINIHLGIHLGAISLNQNDSCLERRSEKDILSKLVVFSHEEYTIFLFKLKHAFWVFFYSHVLPDFLSVSLHTLNQYCSLGVKLNCSPEPVDSAIQLGITWQMYWQLCPTFCCSKKTSRFSHPLFAFLHLIMSHWNRFLLSPKTSSESISHRWGTVLSSGFSRTFPGEPVVMEWSPVCIHGQRVLVGPGLQIKVKFFTRLNIKTG